MTGASSGAQEDAVKAEAKVQDLQGRLKIAEQEKAAAEKAQQVNVTQIIAVVCCTTYTPSLWAVVCICLLVTLLMGGHVQDSSMLLSDEATLLAGVSFECRKQT